MKKEKTPFYADAAEELRYKREDKVFGTGLLVGSFAITAFYEGLTRLHQMDGGTGTKFSFLIAAGVSTFGGVALHLRSDAAERRYIDAPVPVETAEAPSIAPVYDGEDILPVTLLLTAEQMRLISPPVWAVPTLVDAA